MNILTVIYEKLWEHERDMLCDRLNRFVTAQLAGRDRPEESITAHSGSLGIIDICGSPIRWVQVLREGGESANHWFLNFVFQTSKWDPPIRGLI
jgi:hypothetical protein